MINWETKPFKLIPTTQRLHWSPITGPVPDQLALLIQANQPTRPQPGPAERRSAVWGTSLLVASQHPSSSEVRVRVGLVHRGLWQNGGCDQLIDDKNNINLMITNILCNEFQLNTWQLFFRSCRKDNKKGLNKDITNRTPLPTGCWLLCKALRSTSPGGWCLLIFTKHLFCTQRIPIVLIA